MKKKRLPKFKSESEEAEFWAHHSLTDYLHEVKKTDDIFVLSPALSHKIKERSKRRMISIRLAHWEIEKSKEIAKKRGMPYQTLLREWIDIGLRHAFAPKSGRKAA